MRLSYNGVVVFARAARCAALRVESPTTVDPKWVRTAKRGEGGGGYASHTSPTDRRPCHPRHGGWELHGSTRKLMPHLHYTVSTVCYWFAPTCEAPLVIEYLDIYTIQNNIMS